MEVDHVVDAVRSSVVVRQLLLVGGLRVSHWERKRDRMDGTTTKKKKWRTVVVVKKRTPHQIPDVEIESWQIQEMKEEERGNNKKKRVDAAKKKYSPRPTLPYAFFFLKFNPS